MISVMESSAMSGSRGPRRSMSSMVSRRSSAITSSPRPSSSGMPREMMSSREAPIRFSSSSSSADVESPRLRERLASAWA